MTVLPRCKGLNTFLEGQGFKLRPSHVHFLPEPQHPVPTPLGSPDPPRTLQSPEPLWAVTSIPSNVAPTPRASVSLLFPTPSDPVPSASYILGAPLTSTPL